ncbi:MAG: VOC family protein [Gammaproteobacteria bacterium]|nr:VOC family protein [Gammaproteobacteria bacterium]MDH4312174.1 VOC family protein [Gammaproteobacteria bacterium]MDH5274604.1 VOC family protein [Gammaproteobacteria bacterium]
MAENAVRWFEIYVQDMARARRFYETVLGVKLEQLGPVGQDLEMWAFQMSPDGPGAGGALVRAPGMPSTPGGTMVYFGCEDCAVEGGRVEAAGGRIQREKMSIGQYGHIVLAVDTEGNLIGLHSMN